MLKVGITGMGFMGWIHWLAYQKVEGVEVAAICTTEPERLQGDWTGIKGNFGPPGEQVDLSGIATTADFDEMLAMPELDYVDICLPPALHAPFIEKAAAAGKHVFSEKPLALSVDDCDRAVNACREHDRLLMVGQVLPFFPEYAFARSVIDSGEYGKAIGGTFKRVISDPEWLPDFYDPKKIGGPMLDLHVHDAHFIRLLFGQPATVTSGGRMRGEVVEYCNSIFRFDDPQIVVSSVAGVINQQGRPFTHGFELHLERCTMQFEFAGLADGAQAMPLKLLHPDGSVELPETGSGDPVDAFVAEIETVVESMKAGQESGVLSGGLARDAIEICQAQSRSVVEGRTIEL